MLITPATCSQCNGLVAYFSEHLYGGGNPGWHCPERSTEQVQREIRMSYRLQEKIERQYADAMQALEDIQSIRLRLTEEL